MINLLVHSFASLYCHVEVELYAGYVDGYVHLLSRAVSKNVS